MDRFKFRAWNIIVERFEYFDFHDLAKMEHDDIQWHILKFQQCTGLKDKNRKLIYEGDIVRFAEYEIDDIEPEWEYAQIVWGGKYDYPAFDLSKNPFDNNGLSEIFALGWTIEVIGNKFENPELLKECE